MCSFFRLTMNPYFVFSLLHVLPYNKGMESKHIGKYNILDNNNMVPDI